MQKTPSLVGRFGDEYNMFVDDPETVKKRLEVMRASAEEHGRDPDAITISMASGVIVADTDAEYRGLLAERAARFGLDVDAYEGRIAGRHMPRGTVDQAAEIIAGFGELGVSRWYVQEYKHLDDIDTGRLGPILKALRG